MKTEEIFYPNELTNEDVASLSGWKLKVSILHFGVSRGDCVRFGYGYALIKSNVFADVLSIHVVADNDGVWGQPIDLSNEIDWNDPVCLLGECGIKISELYKDRINEKINLRKESELENERRIGTTH